MLMIELIDSGASVATAVSAQTRMLNARKGKDPLVNFALIQNQTTREARLDFVIGGTTAQGASIAEWNAYRYSPHRSANGKTGVMLFAVSRRAYGDSDIRGFLGALKTTRSGEINTLARQPLPSVRVTP